MRSDTKIATAALTHQPAHRLIYCYMLLCRAEDGRVFESQRMPTCAGGGEGGARERYHSLELFSISRNSIIYCPGPKGPDGKGLRKLIEYCSSKDPHYVVEIRPNKRSQGKELGGLFVRYITATEDM